jgi:hypothetical protein
MLWEAAVERSLLNAAARHCVLAAKNHRSPLWTRRHALHWLGAFRQGIGVLSAADLTRPAIDRRA